MKSGMRAEVGEERKNKISEQLLGMAIRHLNSLQLTFQRGVLVGADQSADAFDHLKFIVRVSVFFLS